MRRGDADAVVLEPTGVHRFRNTWEKTASLRLRDGKPDVIDVYDRIRGGAVIAHAAQGMTVDTAHVLVKRTMTRENLYVALTRGRSSNIAYFATDQPDDDHTPPSDNPTSRGLLNQAAPAPLCESFKVAEQNLVAQARALVSDRDPREHNLTAQVRALDATKSGQGLGLPILLALGSAVLQRSVRGGLIAVGNLSLGGGVENVLNAAQIAEHAMEKGATALLLPVSAPRPLLDVSDEVATKVSFIFYRDAQDALVKALDE